MALTKPGARLLRACAVVTAGHLARCVRVTPAQAASGARGSAGAAGDTLPGPLDCRGLGCYSECERRHLDPTERRRFDQGCFRYPERPSLVVTASRDMGRTASTWVYNAVRLLYRQASEACDSYWIRRLTPEKLRERMQTGAHVLVKTHEWTDHLSQEEFDKVQPMFTHVIVSVRKGFPEDAAWMRAATHVIHFEDIVEHDAAGENVGAHRVLRALAEHLGIEGLTDDDIRQIDYELMTFDMPRMGSDPITKHWHFHARRGGRPKPTAPPAPASDP